jgi:hypothetical protein
MIEYNTTVEFTFTFTGIPHISYELKEAIQKFLKMNTSPKDYINCEIDTQESNIVVTTNVNFPQMKLYELKQQIPKMIEAIQNKHKDDEEMEKEFVMNWDKKPLKEDQGSVCGREFARNINKVYTCFKDCKRAKNWEAASLYASDFDDLCEVLKLFQQSEYKEAYFKYRHMDTAAREWVPSTVRKMLVDKAGM